LLLLSLLLLLLVPAAVQRLGAGRPVGWPGLMPHRHGCCCVVLLQLLGCCMLCRPELHDADTAASAWVLLLLLLLLLPSLQLCNDWALGGKGGIKKVKGDMWGMSTVVLSFLDWPLRRCVETNMHGTLH
jgi:hypothetical protein